MLPPFHIYVCAEWTFECDGLVCAAARSQPALRNAPASHAFPTTVESPFSLVLQAEHFISAHEGEEEAAPAAAEGAPAAAEAVAEKEKELVGAAANGHGRL